MRRHLPPPALARAGLLALMVVLAGCASTLANVSAEPTGCAADQLEILDAHQPMEGPSSWTAVCRAPGAEPQQFFCSRAGEPHRVICTEVPPGGTFVSSDG